MVNWVSTVRKLLFLLFCHVGFVTSQNPHTWRSGGFNKYALGVSINTHAWDGSTDFSDEPPWRCLSVLSRGRGVSWSF